MTQEQKAKAYNEAIERAREYKKHGYMMINVALDNIFPELKESEDEKIRKEIISALKFANVKGVYDKHIAWLEKQGEQSIDNLTQQEAMDIAVAKCFEQGGQKPADMIESIFNVGDKIQYSKGCGTIMTIEKIENGEYIFANNMGHTTIESGNKWYLVEQKPTEPIIVGQEPLYNYTNMNIVNKDFEPKSAEEAAKEEKADNQNCVKPTDKVEPKFKNGQWVVWQDKCYKVNYNGCGYELVDQNDLNTSLEYGTIDENAHLWTIQDAKPGDVLVNQNGEMPFIFKECKNNHIYCYCGYTNRKDIFFDRFVDSEGEELHWLNLYHEQAYPATKAQRDLLFQKMKEAGYEWDVEKKELKKIEYDSTFKMKTPEESLGIDSDTYNKIVDECIYGEQKPAWSEEDDEHLERILKELESQYQKLINRPYLSKIESDYNWLKSIKDRVQPKQEWSKEDEKIVEHLINLHKVNLKVNHYPDLEVNKRVNELRMFFKSLRPQNTWKPSEEQIKALYDAVFEANWETMDIDSLESLYNDLKKL